MLQKSSQIEYLRKNIFLSADLTDYRTWNVWTSSFYSLVTILCMKLSNRAQQGFFRVSIMQMAETRERVAAHEQATFIQLKWAIFTNKFANNHSNKPRRKKRFRIVIQTCSYMRPIVFLIVFEMLKYIDKMYYLSVDCVSIFLYNPSPYYITMFVRSLLLQFLWRKFSIFGLRQWDRGSDLDLWLCQCHRGHHIGADSHGYRPRSTSSKLHRSVRQHQVLFPCEVWVQFFCPEFKMLL